MKATSTNPIRARKLAMTWAFFLAIFALAGLLAMQSCNKPDTIAADPNSKNKGTGGGGKQGKGRSLDGGGPAPVVVAKVSQKDVPIEVAVVGNVEAYSTITVIPQVGGQLTEVYVNEGDYVKKGEKLFTVDPRPLEAALAQNQANIERDKALLSQAQANLARDVASEVYARAEAGRYAKLFDDKIVSKEQVDQFKTNADTLEQSVAADRAAIESSRAQINSDQAMIDNARVQLSYTTIPSPIDGRLGNMTVKKGNVVAANSSNLITITQIEPIYATFAVPESTLADVKKYMAQGKLQVTAITQDGTAQKETGVLTFVDNNVDMTTGTIKLKGTFKNSDHKMWPGQYVNVVLRLTTRPKTLVVPNQAVQSGQDGSFVYLVKPDRTVAVAKVTTGPRVDQDLVIESGLSEGDTVVTEGQLRLAPGSRVALRGEGRGEGDGGGGGGRRAGGGKGGDGSGGGRGPTADASNGPSGGPGSGVPGGEGSGGDRPHGDSQGKGGRRGHRGEGAGPAGGGQPGAGDPNSTDHKGRRRGPGTGQ